MTSLDHAMWFHAPFKADQWMLCVPPLRPQYQPRAHSFSPPVAECSLLSTEARDVAGAGMSWILPP